MFLGHAISMPEPLSNSLLIGSIAGLLFLLLSLGLGIAFGAIEAANFGKAAFLALCGVAAYAILPLAWYLCLSIGLDSSLALVLMFAAVVDLCAIVEFSATERPQWLVYLYLLAAVTLLGSFVLWVLLVGLTVHISAPQLFGQLLIGLINGSFYALLSLGLAVIFGMLNIVNFAHGAFYMVGAFAAYFLLHLTGVNYWGALILGPLIVGALGAVMERTLLKRITGLDHLYGLLLTFGLALVIQGLFQNYFGASGLPYPIPPELQGARNLGFMFLPNYRGWVIVFSAVVCFATWFAIEKTRLGAYLRAATENPTLVRAFGINVPLMITLTYGFGVALAALAGVLAAPINQVRPGMGADIIAVVFAVVVIGGMGSILGSILTGFTLGVIEGLTKVFYPEASNTVVFVIMAIVLIIRPSGLFGRVA